MRSGACRLAVLALLVPTGVALAQELTPEQQQYIAANKAQWAKIKTVQVASQSPPKEWKRFPMQEYKASIAFPCEPKRAAVDNGAAVVTMYSCKVEGIGYMLNYVRGKFTGDPELLYAAFESGGMKSLTKGGAKVSAIPIMRVQYSGMSGRELRFITPTFVMQKRSFLVDDTTLLDMQVVHPLSYNGDKPKSFFNSLQVQ
jgi:hypothetical protein